MAKLWKPTTNFKKENPGWVICDYYFFNYNILPIWQFGKKKIFEIWLIWAIFLMKNPLYIYI